VDHLKNLIDLLHNIMDHLLNLEETMKDLLMVIRAHLYLINVDLLNQIIEALLKNKWDRHHTIQDIR
jgi:hypothetical protein